MTSDNRRDKKSSAENHQSPIVPRRKFAACARILHVSMPRGLRQNRTAILSSALVELAEIGSRATT